MIQIRRVGLALLPACGPIALLVYILAGVSLPLGVAAVATCGAVGWIVATYHRPQAATELSGRIRWGAFAGLAATLAYDATRYGIVALFETSYRPFHVFQIFGQLFLGEHAQTGIAIAVGVLYHLCNGIGLGVSYRLLFRIPTMWSGILWALGLEFVMALLYPSWLRITMLREFLAVSALSHLVYGSVLAATSMVLVTGTSKRLRKTA